VSEWKFFDDTSYVSTFEFHEHRERAPHLEQSVHVGRLHLAAEFVRVYGVAVDIVDLGCGDGGLLSLLRGMVAPGVSLRGYDFAPANSQGWLERGVQAEALNFVEQWASVAEADLYVMTEVLEHLQDPHQMVRRVYARNAVLVCSSPFTESDLSHDGAHAWAWDQEGYVKMITDAGFTIERHETVGMFQVVRAVP
jgi:predicted TPR repeat methyltransferase